MIKDISIPGVCILIRETETEIELVRLAVNEDFRGQGLGSTAIRKLQKRGKNIWLEAAPEKGCEKKLEHFYRWHGFNAIGKNSIGETIFKWYATGTQKR